MLSRRTTEPSVFFPWEQRRGLIGAFGRGRARILVLAGAIIVAIIAIHENGERSAAVRATRATLTSVSRATASYRADHGGVCPRAVQDLVAGGYLHADPVDAWGRSLHLECPGRKDPKGFDLWSDGPDGVPGGLDQVR